MAQTQKEHLFISYANEDAALAEWLTLKLTAAGYRVWCDRVKLLGGESYPRDIDTAIKEQAYRMIALLSKHSVDKPNPVKERTLAHNISRERHEDFLIPINVDGIRASELDWMTSDLTFIAFHDNWARGLAQLLRKLQSVSTPCPLSNGKEIAASWFDSTESLTSVPERLWANLLEIREMPQIVLRIEDTHPGVRSWPEEWIYHRQSNRVYWSFEEPPQMSAPPHIESIEWDTAFSYEGFWPRDAVNIIIKKHLRRLCLHKGARETIDRQLYFPSGIVDGDWLRYTDWGGKPARRRSTGLRTFRLSHGLSEMSRYHLSPSFRPVLRGPEAPIVLVQLRVYLTEISGRPLSLTKALRRRKVICKHWWNADWLSRLMAVISWLADGNEEFNIAMGASYSIVLSGKPLYLITPLGINERVVGSTEPEDESAILEDLYQPDEEEAGGWD